MDSGYTPNPNTAHSLDELLSNVPKNQTIGDNLIRAWNIINNKNYETIVCSVSGGSDSDIMVDICQSGRTPQDTVCMLQYRTGIQSNKRAH